MALLPPDDEHKGRLLAELDAIKGELQDEEKRKVFPANDTEKRSPKAASSPINTTAGSRFSRVIASTEELRGGDVVSQAHASKARKRLKQWLQRLFDQLLPSPEVFPLYEIFYDTKLALMRALYPEMERLHESSLVAPASILGCECCSNPSHDISASLPDVCIVFQLMRKERTREVNLADWLASYKRHDVV